MVEELGDYLVRRLIGEGGMGKVYEAEERLSKRRVALKVLHPELARSEQGRRLFLNEMQILAHLEHPNIVRSLASIEVAGELVMVLELLDGKTLRQVLAVETRLAWSESVRIIAAIAGALAAAHGQQPPIIHRDLKPENIMVLSDGAVKVMDFGIAKVIEALNQTNTQSVGTLQYMSPEQIDAHTIDHRSDLYCLGLIFYELIAGVPPFQSASPRQLLNLQCTAEPPPLPDEVRGGLPRGVEQLLFQLLEKAPEDRPYLAEDVIERLDPFQTAVAPAGRASGAGRTGSGSGSTLTPQRTPSRAVSSPAVSVKVESEKAPAVSAARSEDRAPVARAEAPKPVERADTIALVDQMDRPRDVSNKVAIALVVGLSLLAGIGAYVVRSTSGPADVPSGGPTASIGQPPPPVSPRLPSKR